MFSGKRRSLFAIFLFIDSSFNSAPYPRLNALSIKAVCSNFELSLFLYLFFLLTLLVLVYIQLLFGHLTHYLAFLNGLTQLLYL